MAVLTMPTTEIADERAVEEVHCAECNIPLTAIPNWYANVRVRFIGNCDICRHRSPRLAASPVASDGEMRLSSGEIADPDLEPALEEAELEEVSLDEVDAEVGDDE